MSRAKDPRADGASSSVSRSLLPVVDRLVENRYVVAEADVARLRAEHPDDSPDELANRLIRRYAKDLAMGGAVAGGAAASPVAGMAVAAASAGADAAFSVSRLGEMVMAIGIVYGHDALSVDERRTAVLAAMGIADSAAVGMTGLAARAGSRGGARVIRRLPVPGAAVTGGVGRRAVSKLSNTKGPWSLTSLIPYGIGAGVGAAGNALLARAVGRAAKEYFSGSVPARAQEIVVEVIDDESELLDPEPGYAVNNESDPTASRSGDHGLDLDPDIVDAEIVD